MGQTVSNFKNAVSRVTFVQCTVIIVLNGYIYYYLDRIVP